MKSIAERLEAAQNRRYAAIAKMEDSQHRMQVAERNGAGVDPADAAAFEAGRTDVLAVDVELRELQAQARQSLDASATTRLDVWHLSGMPDTAQHSHAAALAPSGRVDVGPLYRALQQSNERTTGSVVCKTLLQGVATGNLGRTTQEGGVVAVGSYGALPLVLAVQTIPVQAGVYHWNRVEAVSAPATGATQSTEGAVKAQVELKSTPVTSVLATFAAWEKCSLQSLEDQVGLAQAVEGLLTGAVFRAADADAWAAFVAGATAIAPDVDGVGTIVRTAAKIATAGGIGIRAVLNPEDYADMMLTKADTSGNWLGLPPGVEMPAIVQSSGVPSGKLLVTAGADGSFVALRQSVNSMVGLSGDDFVRNLRTVLVEARMTAAVRNAQLAYIGDLVAAP